MKYSNKIALLLFATVVVGCSSSENKQSHCDATNTAFNTIYQTVLSMPTNEDIISGPAVTHAYSFEVTRAKNMCSIGYQSIPGMETTPYHIELYDTTSAVVLYSGDHTFSSAATSYVSVGTIPLVVGHSYTIKRVQTTWGSSTNNAEGRLVRGIIANFNFPFTSGDLKVTGSYFSDGYGAYLPFIDIVFE